MPWWVKPWLCFSVLGLGIVLNIRPVAQILEAALRQELTGPVAALIGAALGFSGVILTTWAGFRNLVASNEAQARRERESREAQAARDREARAEQALLAEQVRREDRDYERRILAAALHGELIGLLNKVHASTSLYDIQQTIMEHLGNDRAFSKTPTPFSLPTYEVPVFDANIAKLGLLGASLAGDVVQVYAMAKSKGPSTESAKAFPELVSKFYRGVVETHKVWSEEIVHVGSRLSHAQFGGTDPGTLYDLRQRKEREKKDAGSSRGVQAV